ncbi:MAG TPA: glycosyltransferase family 4 protein [Gemmataceae bacterium]|nr:glycosyltransferase family 4 protein [Gemmataceae bacterium]
MSRVAIVSPAILPGDAIGRDVLHMGHVLREQGHEVELFSTTWGKPQPRNDRDVHVRDFLADDPSALLILHHAIGWPHAVPLIDAAKCRRVVKYHNVTPARFYDGLDAEYAELCRRGPDQLREIIARQCDLYLADSPFNLKDLVELGADPRCCAVLPPFNDLENLLDIDPDPEILHDYGDGRTNLLFVGRRAPNKGHRFLIDAFAAYHHGCNANSRLVMIGRGEPKQEKYAQSLREQVWRLGLHGHVVFVDSVSDAELKAHYQCASVYVLASEHEGFCVPLVEAMALRVPIVAYGAGAVPHTVGDAALIWDERDPFLLAQSVAVVVGDAAVRRLLTERGWRRYQECFINQRLERDFLHAMWPLLHCKPAAFVKVSGLLR